MTIRRIPFTCTLDCGNRCQLVALVEGDRFLRIDTPGDLPDTLERPRLIPCLRGRSHRRLLNVPERILHPMRHDGPRGAGSWQAISWDDALDLVAERLSVALAEGGPRSIVHGVGAGSISGRGFTGSSASARFFSHWAPVIEISGDMSTHNVTVARNWMFGGRSPESDRATIVDSCLILLWGNNPAETHMGPNTTHFIAEARERGAYVVLLDPRLTETGVLADEWVPLRPGSDAALAAAMVWVMLDEGLEDREFLARCVTGFGPYRDYVLGADGGQPCTPEWAEPLTGVPAATTRRLARRYATERPARLLAGLGPQRGLYGEQAARALFSLMCTSGNVGLRARGQREPEKAVTAAGPVRLTRLPEGPYKPSSYLSCGSWAATLLEGSLDPAPAVLYIVASNMVNRSQASLLNLEAMARVPFVVVQDPFMTPTALHADLVLPATMDLERSDLVGNVGPESALFYSQQVVAPVGEARSDYWVMARLAERLGVGEAYTGGRTEEEWLAEIMAQSKLPPELEREGVLRVYPTPRIALETFRADPARDPLPTASGLIELCNPQAAEYDLPVIASHVPVESWGDAYPLQLLSPHHKTRSNSCLAANPWLQHAEPHGLWLSRTDADARGVSDGDLVRVTSPYGSTRVAARVTETIMPGVVSLPQGTWLDMRDGEDVGGAANVLTTLTLSPTGGPSTHTVWVDVEPCSD